MYNPQLYVFPLPLYCTTLSCTYSLFFCIVQPSAVHIPSSCVLYNLSYDSLFLCVVQPSAVHIPSSSVLDNPQLYIFPLPLYCTTSVMIPSCSVLDNPQLYIFPLVLYWTTLSCTYSLLFCTGQPSAVHIPSSSVLYNPQLYIVPLALYWTTSAIMIPFFSVSTTLSCTASPSAGATHATAQCNVKPDQPATPLCNGNSPMTAAAASGHRHPSPLTSGQCRRPSLTADRRPVSGVRSMHYSAAASDVWTFRLCPTYRCMSAM